MTSCRRRCSRLLDGVAATSRHAPQAFLNVSFAVASCVFAACCACASACLAAFFCARRPLTAPAAAPAAAPSPASRLPSSPTWRSSETAPTAAPFAAPRAAPLTAPPLGASAVATGAGAAGGVDPGLLQGPAIALGLVLPLLVRRLAFGRVDEEQGPRPSAWRGPGPAPVQGPARQHSPRPHPRRIISLALFIAVSFASCAPLRSGAVRRSCS